MIQFSEAATGTIAAALIAGLVSVLSLVISKEAKISDLRQVWIDALREDIAHLVALAGQIVSQSSNDSGSVTESTLREASERHSRISLRLNLREIESQALSRAILKLQGLTEQEKPDPRGIQLASDDVISCAQIVLKKEWDRVKTGEKSYRIALFTLIPLLAVFIPVFFWSLVTAGRHDNDATKPGFVLYGVGTTEPQSTKPLGTLGPSPPTSYRVGLAFLLAEMQRTARETLDGADISKMLNPLVQAGELTAASAGDIRDVVLQGAKEISVDGAKQLIGRLLERTPKSDVGDARDSNNSPQVICAPTMIVSGAATQLTPRPASPRHIERTGPSSSRCIAPTGTASKPPI